MNLLAQIGTAGGFSRMPHTGTQCHWIHGIKPHDSPVLKAWQDNVRVTVFDEYCRCLTGLRMTGPQWGLSMQEIKRPGETYFEGSLLLWYHCEHFSVSNKSVHQILSQLVATGETDYRQITFFPLCSLNPNCWKLLFKPATMASSVAYPDKHSWGVRGETALSQQSSRLPVLRRLSGECWRCGSCVKTHLKDKCECVSAAEAVLTLLVKFPCTRPSTKSCDLKALTKDERDSMERPFISVWYLSVMDHLPCSKMRRRTSLQCKKENTTAGCQELLSVRDAISDSGLYWRQGALLWADCVLPQHLLLATGHFSSDLDVQSDPCVRPAVELPKLSYSTVISKLFSQPPHLLCSHFSPSPRTHLARVSGLMRMLKYVFFSCSVIISNTAGVKLKSDK